MLRSKVSLAAWILATGGLAYLAFKADYLSLETSDALKAFIVSPAAVLLTLAALVAFPDTRRRTGSALLGLGLVALVWLAREPLPSGWTFSTPTSLMDEGGSPAPLLKGPSPWLTAAATMLPFFGLVLFRRRSLWGGFLLGAALWSALCFAPSHLFTGWTGARRYHYYYFAGTEGRPSGPWDRSDAVFPIVLGAIGFVLLERSGSSPKRSAASE